MEKTIIVLGGTANTGKSMTLVHLGNQLQTNANTITRTNLGNNDYRAVFQYKKQIIGLNTAGDTLGIVTEGLNEFLQKQCGIIAIASKAYGATVIAISEFATQNGYRVIWTKPYVVWDNHINTQRIKNYTASQLHKMIDDVITGSL